MIKAPINHTVDNEGPINNYNKLGMLTNSKGPNYTAGHLVK